MDNERLKTLLYNSIVMLEESEEKSHEKLLNELGMTEEEYGIIMVPESDIHYFDVHFATEPDGSGFSVFVTASDETSAVSIARAKADAYDEINDYVEEIDEDEYKRANKEVSVCKDGSKIETAAGTLIAQPYDDGCAKGMKLIIKDEIIGMCDVTEDGEIRLLGYHDGSDEPSICYSINR